MEHLEISRDELVHDMSRGQIKGSFPSKEEKVLFAAVVVVMVMVMVGVGRQSLEITIEMDIGEFEQERQVRDLMEDAMLGESSEGRRSR